MLVAGGLLGSCSRQSPGEERAKPGAGKPVPVTVATVVRKSLPVELRTFGTVEPSAIVAIRAELGEILETVHIRKGQKLNKGDLLFTIDPRPFRAVLEQAKANLARDMAQAANAKREAERELSLLKKSLSSEQDYEKAKTTAEAMEAVVSADRAAVNAAELQVEHCFIRSPVDGVAGNVLVDQGNLLKITDMVLVIINRIRPVEVSFSIPQADLPAVRRYMADANLPVQAVIPREENDPEKGDLTFVDNAVDKTTGTIQLRGTFANLRERLWPGQYVQVTLKLTTQNDAITAPTRAVQTGRDGKYVFVIKPDGTAEFRPIVPGRTAGLETVVAKGLLEGERVVTDGHLRLVNGARVEVQGERGGRAGTQPASASSGPASRGSAGTGAGS